MTVGEGTLEVLVDMFAHGGVQRGLGIVEGAQARLQLVPGANQGVDRLVQFALGRLGAAIADPQALLEQGAQARVHGLLGFDLAGGGLVRADRHDRVRALEPVAAILQVGFQAVGIVHQVLQGAMAPPRALMAQYPDAEHDG